MLAALAAFDRHFDRLLASTIGQEPLSPPFDQQHFGQHLDLKSASPFGPKPASLLIDSAPLVESGPLRFVAPVADSAAPVADSA